MMAMADGGFGIEISGVDDFDCFGEGGEDLMMDLDTLLGSLSDSDDPSQGDSKDSSHQNSEVESVTEPSCSKNFQAQTGFQMLGGTHASESESMNPATICYSHNPNVLDDRFGGSVNSLEYVGNSAMALDDGKLESYSQFSCPMRTCSGSPKEWHGPFSKDHETERLDVSQSGTTGCSEVSTPAGESIQISNTSRGIEFDALLGESEAQLRAAGRNDVEDIWQDHYMESCSDRKSGIGGSLAENSLRMPGPENEGYNFMDLPFDAASSDIIVTNQSTFHSNSDGTTDYCGHYSAPQIDSNSGDTYLDLLPSFSEDDFNFDFFPSNGVDTTNDKDKVGEFPSESACSVSAISVFDYADTSRLSVKNGSSNCFSSNCENIKSNASSDRILDDKSSGIPITQSAINKQQPAVVKNEKIRDVAACRSMIYPPYGINHNKVNRMISSSDESSLVEEKSRQLISGFSSSLLSLKNSVCMKDQKVDKSSASRIVQLPRNTSQIPLDGEKSSVNKKLKICVNGQRSSDLIIPKSLGHFSSISRESIQSNLSGSSSHVDDDSEICILEDISQPACLNHSLQLGKANATPLPSAHGDSIYHNAVGSTRNRVNDEHLILRAALQEGLSQPKSEANPPEGVLAVPLLRHQRIALSWMVQKETSSIYCCGGILADDQGLGKTVSTIALILKERPPPVKTDMQVVKKEETLNLDEDDDEVIEVDTMKNCADSCQPMPILFPKERTNSPGQSKGRPSAGTLVVCPTSVLRQWDDELRKKVTSKANLSVLLYHGSNRTKDPCELAKYDVVLTTYAIVSMEVPKQPIEDDDEKEKPENDDVTSLGLSSGKKRKYPPSYGKKGGKNKKGMDSALLESAARPLAKVAWFRVVLDEAQSIKNHRTQVARACWGLRAKRRWCLSGTPIQNSIDDLYSYFRFLRYDPYAFYKSFCYTIKVPIQKNPIKGYKKLQAVLRTIMLRRTKGTQIDGKPIINLPPKLVELKKVDFTDEERDFYTRLEAESRDQFREYAAAGTVKQNYVNILLMLLRLRQACDHPLLVRGKSANSLGKSSIEIAKKLPREKQIDLLNCLEASLAICGICNDPPEDAVVSTCGHVFCHQCICQRITGDENQCPNSKCKVRLNVSSVFSKTTLKSCLSGQPDEIPSGSEITAAVNPNSESLSYNSSKIKAALEVLESLTKPNDATSSLDYGDSVVCPESSSNSGISDNDNVNCLVKKAAGEKAIVFSQWTRMLDLLEACLKKSSIQYRRLDGTMSVAARDKAVQDFNTRPEVSVMIMSLKAASLGLNMVAACRVLLLDLWWNPTTEDQAIDRAHRIGQTRPVTVLRLTVKDTVEDRILALQQKKREMVASAFGEDENGARQTRLTMEDLHYLFMV